MILLTRGEHQRSFALRIPEDQQLGRRHAHSDLRRFPAVVNLSEERDTFGQKPRKE